MASEKLTEPIMVRCSEQDLIFLDKFIKDCGGDLSYGAAFRTFLSYFRADYDDIGPARCLLKTVNKLQGGGPHE